MAPLVSICIPLYNGEDTIVKTLDSILGQEKVLSEIEIVLCDDGSTDNTYSIAESYKDKFSCISLYKNAMNLGMDGNFERVADLAKGEYIWFSGQDDIFKENSLTNVLNVLKEKPEVDFIYVNFTQVSHDLKQVISEKAYHIQEDLYFPQYQEFIDFTGIKNLPTFLPAYVIRKRLWSSVDKSIYHGTYYIQVGTFLTLLPLMKCYVIAESLIEGRIPDDGWQSFPIKKFHIFYGNLWVINKFKGLFPKKQLKEYRKTLKLWIERMVYKIKIRETNINYIIRVIHLFKFKAPILLLKGIIKRNR